MEFSRIKETNWSQTNWNEMSWEDTIEAVKFDTMNVLPHLKDKISKDGTVLLTSWQICESSVKANGLALQYFIGLKSYPKGTDFQDSYSIVIIALNQNFDAFEFISKKRQEKFYKLEKKFVEIKKTFGENLVDYQDKDLYKKFLKNDKKIVKLVMENFSKISEFRNKSL